MEEEIALFLGRFQPFHKGHKFVLENELDNYRVKIVIGSSNRKRTFKNPLSFKERKRIIENCFPELEIFKVPDFESDEKWTQEILERFEYDFVVSGNPHVQECFQGFGVKVKRPSLFQPEKYKGELIRNRALKGKDWISLVPECTLEVLKRIDFEKILKEVSL